MTVKESVLQTFNNLPNEFSILDLIKDVRILLKRPYLTDGTITKELRNLRADEKLNYEVTDQLKAKYKKIIKE